MRARLTQQLPCWVLMLLLNCTSSVAATLHNWLPLAPNASLLQQLPTKVADQYRASYVQRRQLQIMAKPLVSEGYILLTPQQGLMWQQQLPIKQTLVVTEKEVSQFDSQDLPMPIPMAAQQMIKAWAPMMKQVIQGQWQLLAQQFHLSATEQSTPLQWQLLMLPLDSSIQQALTRIELSGSEGIELISMHQVNGDVLTVELSAMAAQALSDRELSWLNE
ncbi:outer membrane lipoprotein carrier protein LolA [Agarivorans sp. TSD2052]|uniref:outer membrane lipoprotein carrier protein LolA n=1 Tax=Agarivorans sp. TSD2052 TaxID=2937286 RepID=UPI00200FF228|nr:outer membrane lipoprotein carrier protein LolA [Agarivorans sp. TSD2052]UPW19347.1 outer membrane lipoprotein carrier protein LolA [Agarivorans sp. TSD2052]